MTTPPQTDVHTAPMGSQTERVLHEFVRDAVSRLAQVLNGSAPVDWEDIKFERGADGHFRERKTSFPSLWPALNPEWLSSLPNYAQCVACLKADVVIGPHIDRLVGTPRGAYRLDAENIFTALIYSMVSDDGSLSFADENFHHKWRELTDFFATDRLDYTTVVPLPNLVVPVFPLRLNDELVLDRLTEDEVTRCYQTGVLRPTWYRSPIIASETAVGIRRTTFLPKIVRRGDEAPEPIRAQDEGSFGRRPYFRDDLVIDDILSAVRLFRHTEIRAAGLASWTNFPWLGSGTQSRVLWQWPFGSFELLDCDVPQFLELWYVLEKGAGLFGFSIHRFNLAFDRGLLADRIVDLVIAAEALFLGDLRESGELRFRFALRAAKFIEPASYSEHEVYRVMRKAYDARSAIVHGGSPKDTGLPGNPSADLRTFIDAIEDLVRLGLRKALSMKENGKRLRQAEYWEALILSKAAP